MKKFLLTVGILALSLPAFAGIGVKESTSTEYLKNYGLSSDTVKFVQLNKAQVNGETYVTPISERRQSRLYTNSEIWNNIVDGTVYFFNYLDPAQDRDEFMRHDIRPYVNVHDL